MTKKENNVVELVREENETPKKINIVRNHLAYSKIIEFVETIAHLSFDKDGRYRKYLKDYAEALTILEVYTDYDGPTDIDAVLSVYNSPVWDEIVSTNRKEIMLLDDYVTDIINYETKPFADVSKTVLAIRNAAEKIYELLGSIDTEKIANLDIDVLSNALDEIADVKENKIEDR